MAKFSDRFKSLRVERQMSQQQMADFLHFSKSRVNMYERGEREPNLETMEDIADRFNIDLDYLIGRSDTPNRSNWLNSLSKAKPAQADELTSDERAMLSAIRALPPAKRQALLALLGIE